MSVNSEVKSPVYVEGNNLRIHCFNTGDKCALSDRKSKQKISTISWYMRATKIAFFSKIKWVTLENSCVCVRQWMTIFVILKRLPRWCYFKHMCNTFCYQISLLNDRINPPHNESWYKEVKHLLDFHSKVSKCGC